MLFMGSTKYPDENEYDSFISKSGGSSNAFTECEYTLYHFDVLPQHLEKVKPLSMPIISILFRYRNVNCCASLLMHSAPQPPFFCGYVGVYHIFVLQKVGLFLLLRDMLALALYSVLFFASSRSHAVAPST